MTDLTSQQMSLLRDTLGLALKKGSTPTRNAMSLHIQTTNAAEVAQLVDMGMLLRVVHPRPAGGPVTTHEATAKGVEAIEAARHRWEIR